MSVCDFMRRGVDYDTLPVPVQRQLVRAVTDVLGAAVAGLVTPTSAIMRDYAAAVLPGCDATIYGAGRTGNAAGAALANACAANALDIDDGFRLAKGHPGAMIVPAALAVAEATGATGKAFLEAVLVGYEVGMRASVAWHGRRPFYSGSGSWGSLATAAASARLLKLDLPQIEQALGIAEYHAPWADVMASCDHPCMAKDGVHWGAFTGVTAAQLAQRGFTGIPSMLNAPAHAPLMASLGQEWWIERLYVKFFPCCRWAQPAVAGVLALRSRHGLAAVDVSRVRVEAFEAATHLATRRPRNTEEGQYSLPFPVACALVRGRVTAMETAGDGLTDPDILAVSDRVDMVVAPDLEARFPAEALERVTLTLRDGRILTIGPLAAPGDAGAPPSDKQMERKFLDLTEPVLGETKARVLLAAARRCAEMRSVDDLTRLLA